jgi:hypothetical protein
MKDKKFSQAGVAVRKKYVKPVLTVIDLAADEVLVVSCKSTNVSGMFADTCNGGGLNPCYQEGS